MGEPELAGSGPTAALAIEAVLLRRVRERDMKAFEQLYRAYHGKLHRFLHHFLRRPHLVEEVLSDTMMVVWNRIDSFDGRSRFSTWLFGIGYRQGMAALRKLDEAREGDVVDVADVAERGPEEGAARDRARRAVHSALGELSPSHRAVVELTYFQEFGYREIAEVLDCPVDTVKTRMFHARRHLRRILPGDPGDWI